MNATLSTPRPNSKLANTAAYYLSIFILGLFTAISGPALPSLAENTTSTLDRISVLFVLGGLGYLLGSYIGGRAYDRFPGNRLIALTLLLISACAIFIPLTHLLWVLLLAQFILSLAQGANDVGCNTLLVWLHGKNSGPYINGLHFFFGLGAFIAPLALAGILTRTGDIQWAFWIFAMVGVPLAFWLWHLPEPPARDEADEKTGGKVPVVPIILLIAAFLVYVGAEVGFGHWLYTYTITLSLGTTVTAAYLNSAFWGTFTAGRLLAVWVSTRVRAAIILYIDLIGSAASIAVIMLWPDSQAALWIGSAGLGLFMASVFPTMLVLAAERMRMTGTITGWFLVGGGAGGMILPWVIGQAFASFGPWTMPALVLGGVVLNLLAVVVFVQLKPRQA